MNPMSRMKFNGLLKKAKKFFEKRKAGQADLSNEIKNLKELALFYDEHLLDKELPHPETHAFEYYRAAATLGDAEAQFTCGQRLCDEGRAWTEWAQSDYASPMHVKYASDCFQEAYHFLQQAEEQKHPLAMRLHGLAYINGWGVIKDPNRGYELVFASIDTENAWDNVKEICTEWNIDSKEFYEKIRNLRKEK